MDNLFTLSENANMNYVAKIIKVDNVAPLPNSDRLDMVKVNGNVCIVGKGTVDIGDIMVYCATESALNAEFLSANNLFEDTELNKDPSVTTGYVKSTGRVRAINLRGTISVGLLCPMHYFITWLSDLGFFHMEKYVGVEFDTVNGVLFAKKYVPKVKENRTIGGGQLRNSKRDRHIQQFDKLVENQFHFHIDTSFFENCMHLWHPDDIVHISSKWHGTSCITAHIKTKTEHSWCVRLLKKMGLKIADEKYDFIFSSRGVIKNRYINKEVTGGYYKTDIWTDAGQQLAPYMPKGMTIYSELVGYLPATSTFIQKNHDYGCKKGEYKIMIYRITTVNEDGYVYEFTPKQVQEFCADNGLNAVQELYYGRLGNLYPDLDISNHWRTNLLERLKNDKERFFMEMDSPDCKNKVPHEGIVIRKSDSNRLLVNKLKTVRHYAMETEELDKEISNIETEESDE